MKNQMGGTGKTVSARKQRAWPQADIDELKRLWPLLGGSRRRIGAAMGRSPHVIHGKSRVLNLQFPHGAPTHHLEPTHPAAAQGATRFPSRVMPAAGMVMLKSGDNQRKLGRAVQKGPWRGMPIFSLTLEERATCPRSCKQWLNCYGNNMGHAKRFEHGAALENQISAELTTLQRRHPRGFVVRLHILGDFYSLVYVRFWESALDLFPALRVFGYTARQRTDRIGLALADLRDARWDCFAIRTSGGTFGPSTMVIDRPDRAGPGVIICPAQTGGTACCATRGLCWAPAASLRPIAFLEH